MTNEYFSSLFPNNSTVAKYVFISQTIHLDAYDKEKFDISNQQDKKVLIHECTHYFDHFSTLWGINNIAKIFNALNARLNDMEQHLFHVVLLAEEIKKMTTKTYYKTISDNADKYTGKWNMRYSVGLRYNKRGLLNDNDPIIFIRFIKENGELLSRVPLSIGSLFESRAMACEFLIDIDEYKKVSDDGERIVSMNLLNKECLNWLYDTSLTEYSVAAHFVANEFESSDIIETFFQTFLFSTLALNIPDVYFEQLKFDRELVAFFRGRENAFITNCDRSFLFYILVKNSAKIDMKITVQNINEVLKCSNLPPWEEILKTIQDEVESIHEECLTGPLFNRLMSMQLKSVAWFRNFTFSLYPPEIVENIAEFPIIFGDECDTVFCKWYDTICDCQQLLNEFVDAC
jgi:hypothetical protein